MMDLYFNENYAKLYEKIDGRSATFTHECAYGKIKNTFILREISTKIDGETYFDIVTPYGYGGPVVTECSDIKKLMESFIEFYLLAADLVKYLILLGHYVSKCHNILLI